MTAATASTPGGTAEQSLKAVLNHLDAVVYVADMATHEILFINDMVRRQLGDAVGKKCYHVFQQRNSPCPFCTNSLLLTPDGMPTGVHQWEHKNPVTGRWYELRDQAISWVDGRIVRLEIGVDITEKKLRDEELRLHSRLLRSLLYAAEQFLHGNDWSAVAPSVLEDLGRRTAAGAICLFECGADQDGRPLLFKRAGWTAATSSAGDAPTIIELHRFPGLSTVFAGREVRCLDTDDLPPDERDAFRRQSIQSFCVAPVIIAAHPWGWLCFAAPDKRRWSPVEVNALKVAAGILSAAVRRQGIETELDLARRDLERKVDLRTRELRGSRDRLNREVLARQKTAETLASRSRELEEVNIALRVLLQQSSAAKNEQEKRMEDNLRKLVFPYLDSLRLLLPEGRQREYVAIVRANLRQIASAFSLTIHEAGAGMTTREIQVADLIKQGKTSKEIATISGLSIRTVETYRNRIRRKLGLRRKKVNLQTHLTDLLG